MPVPSVLSFSGPTFETDAADNILTVNKPSGTVEHDLLLALFHFDIGTRGCVWPAGWTEAYDDGIRTENARMCVAWKIAGDSEPSSYDFEKDTDTGSVMGGAILRITGHTASPVEVATIGINDGNSTTAEAPSIITENPDVLIVRLMAFSADDYTDDNSPSGHTVHYATASALGLAGLTIACASKQQTTQGASGTADFTGFTATADWTTLTFAVAGLIKGDCSTIVDIERNR